MSVPPGPTIATATLQLFFAASASAGAAAFLAFSRLMAVPYGFGICATALATTPSANIIASTYLTITFCDMLSPLRFNCFLFYCSPLCNYNWPSRYYGQHCYSSQSAV